MQQRDQIDSSTRDSNTLYGGDGAHRRTWVRCKGIVMTKVARKTYRLVLSADSRGIARVIEFEGEGPECALVAVDRYCNGREALIYEAGSCLGRVRKHQTDGFWVVGPGD